MKKIQRSFTIEYKSGRRKPDAKPNSIWGNMDLKSVALDLEEEAMPFVPNRHLVSKSAGEVSPSKAEPAGPLLTPAIVRHTTAAVKEEMMMADEIDTISTADAPAVVGTAVAPKKQRKPRTKKVVLAAASSDAAGEPAIASADAAGKQKRGRKGKSVGDAGTAKRVPVKRAQRPVQAAPAVSATPSDEMADILQLEEENQRLRKLLAEKLRAENTDLRKRLKLD
ncbi:transcriptional regulator [Pararhizobium polonicum]|uniref:Transcriptional regulator n=1 Tax=Pararhizobium polonicum TaxID=1612624 RepID=A0A1C7NTA0_9HYPH|nr:transcriptional regulator [Pararhizobium polonicum]OBZ92220.1 transcriptional regulator [Pararhizobium polonicum]